MEARTVTGIQVRADGGWNKTVERRDVDLETLRRRNGRICWLVEMWSGKGREESNDVGFLTYTMKAIDRECHSRGQETQDIIWKRY